MIESPSTRPRGLVRSLARALRSGPARQERCRDAPRRAPTVAVVEATPPDRERRAASGTLLRPRCRPGPEHGPARGDPRGGYGPDFDRTPVERLLIACRAILFYAGKLIAPVQADVLLSPLARRPARRRAVASRSLRGADRRRPLPAPSPNGQGAGHGGALLRRDPLPRTRLRERLPVTDLARRRPFPVSRQCCPAGPVRRRRRVALAKSSGRNRPSSPRRGLAVWICSASSPGPDAWSTATG